jgi:hypothetical protein
MHAGRKSGVFILRSCRFFDAVKTQVHHRCRLVKSFLVSPATPRAESASSRSAHDAAAAHGQKQVSCAWSQTINIRTQPPTLANTCRQITTPRAPHPPHRRPRRGGDHRLNARLLPIPAEPQVGNSQRLNHWPALARHCDPQSLLHHFFPLPQHGDRLRNTDGEDPCPTRPTKSVAPAAACRSPSAPVTF